MGGFSYLRYVASILGLFSCDVFYLRLLGGIIELLESQRKESFLFKEAEYEDHT